MMVLALSQPNVHAETSRELLYQPTVLMRYQTSVSAVFALTVLSTTLWTSHATSPASTLTGLSTLSVALSAASVYRDATVACSRATQTLATSHCTMPSSVRLNAQHV